jgi:HlyD family secretion protein
MTSRHGVLLPVVLLLAAGLASGVLWRLQGTDEGRDGTSRSAADSVREQVRSETSPFAFSSEVAVPVKGARVRRDTFVLWVEAEGSAEAFRRTVLRAQVEGDVEAVPVREGRRVAAGALVARLDSAPHALDLRARRAERERALAEYRSMLIGEEELGLTAEEREERRRQARARSGLARAEVDLEKARYELEATRIRAPFAGQLAGVAVSPGDRLAPGDSVAAVLDLSRLEVEVRVLQEQVPHLAPGRRARVRFTALPGETFTGRMVSVNPVVEHSSGRVRVTVRLDNPEARVLPGMHATAEIAGRRHPDRIFVPRDALVERDRRQVLFLFEPEETGAATGRAQWRYVATGLESDRYVEVLPEREGDEVPEAGAVVLVDGHTTLAHDARVRLANADSLGAR